MENNYSKSYRMVKANQKEQQPVILQAGPATLEKEAGCVWAFAHGHFHSSVQSWGIQMLS